jgi:LL-diaminopimelate aminotransferase
LLPENNFKPSIIELQGLLTPKTKCLWLNFPSNPTGQIFTKDEIAEYVAFARMNNIWLIYDNAYSEITFGDFIAPSVLEILGAIDIAVEVHSFSKSFSFAGYRMGWVAGNPKVINALAKVKSQVDSGMASPLQKLGAFALTNVDRDWLASMHKSYTNRQFIIGDYLHKLGLSFVLPKGSLYLWARIPVDQVNSEEFSMKILNEKQILLTPGTAFGKNGSDYIRASICSNIDEIDRYF